MINAIENVLNLVVKPKYPLIDEIKVLEDNDFDYTTYIIYIIANNYKALKDEYEIVEDIKNLCRNLGLKKRDIEKITFATKV